MFIKKISVFPIPKIAYIQYAKINTLYPKPTYKLIFFSKYNIISEQQFCKFLTFNIEFFKSYNFSKILLVFFSVHWTQEFVSQKL